MLTLDRTAAPLALSEERPLQPAFVGGLLFAGLEIVPLTADGPVTLLRSLGICLLAAIAVGLGWLGRPRTRRRPLPLAGSDATHPVRVELTGDALPPVYRALLVMTDASRQLVLEGPEPARILEDSAFLAKQLRVPLGPGWGLGEDDLAELTSTTDADDRRWGPEQRFTSTHPPLAGQRAAALTTLWASGFVLIATLVMVNAPERLGLVPSTLALTLPGLGAFWLLLIGLWLLGLRERVVIDRKGASRQRLWFSRALGKPDVHTLAVSAAALVRPATGTAGHLLIAGGTRLLSLPAETPDGSRLLQRSGAPAPLSERAAE